MLWLCAIVVSIASAIGPDGMPKRAMVIYYFALPLVVSTWVEADARKRGRRLCYDYDSFVYFAWPIIVPVYLFQTRRLRAILTLLCFAGIWFVASVTAGLIYFLRTSTL